MASVKQINLNLKRTRAKASKLSRELVSANAKVKKLTGDLGKAKKSEAAKKKSASKKKTKKRPKKKAKKKGKSRAKKRRR